MRHKSSIDLRPIINTKCCRCDSDKRSQYIKNAACINALSMLDNLPVRCVGKWAYEKIYRLTNYFNIFAAGMKNKWDGLNYIEICSGPGRCVKREDGEEIDGTAISILRQPAFDFIKKAIFIDNSKTVVDVLSKRVKEFDPHAKVCVVKGDYGDDKFIKELLSRLTKRYLNLCFIDPTHCDVPFSTIKIISECIPNVDFIINVALGTDVARNIAPSVISPSHEKARSKYIKFLGSDCDYFSREEVINYAKAGKDDELRRVFINDYIEQFVRLGFVHNKRVAVKHYYNLLFLSRSSKGLEFWEKANKISPDNQRELL